MISRKVFFATLAVAALVSGATFVSAQEKKADEKKGIAYDLSHYLPVRTLLAADKLTGEKDKPGVKEHADLLAKSDDKAIAKAGEELAKALATKTDDVAAARKIFGDLSNALIAEIDALNKKGEKFQQVFVFECSMTKPYGKWVQESKEIGNPYQGSKMPKCGKLLGTAGDENCKDGCCDGDKKDMKGGCCGGDEKKQP